ncbi:MAG: hypothetical protein ACLGJC_11415 [Alphaproteobacteria bacterium]
MTQNEQYDPWIPNKFIRKGELYDKNSWATKYYIGGNSGIWDGGGGLNTLSLDGGRDLMTGMRLSGDTIYARQVLYYTQRWSGQDTVLGNADMVLVKWRNFQSFKATEYDDDLDFSITSLTGVTVDAGDLRNATWRDDRDRVVGTAYNDLITVYGAGDTVQGGGGDDHVSVVGGYWQDFKQSWSEAGSMGDWDGGDGLDYLSFDGLGYAKGDFAGTKGGPLVVQTSDSTELVPDSRTELRLE